jgi:alpha-1,3/alpha-1,6-mannosyltransferase
VYTPSHEHFGIVPVEGMYSGLPVLAVNNGGPSESILQGQTGFLCDSDVASFTEGLTKILQLTGKEREKMRKSARKRVLDNFTLDSFVKNLDQGLRELQDQKKQTTPFFSSFVAGLLFGLIVLIVRQYIY